MKRLILLMLCATAFAQTHIRAGQIDAKSLETVVYVDALNSQGWSGSSVDQWIAAANTALGSGGTIRLASGAYTIAGTINAASNVSLECDPSHNSILTVTASFNGTAYAASGITNFGMKNCVIDGNRSLNANSNGLIVITNSTVGVIQNNYIRNSLGNGIYLPNGDSQIDIVGNQVYNLGPLLPSQTVAINIGGSGGNPVSHLRIKSNWVHDCSLGIYVQPNVGSANVEEDIEISGNQVSSCANDGIAIFSANHSGGPIRGVRTINNETYCHGWPASGIGFNTRCTPGLLQTGSIASSSGVGIDYNSSLQEQGIIANNRSHDNYFEGIDVEDAIVSTVSTVGTAMSWVSNDLFLTSWKLNQSIRLGANTFHISSCSSTTSCTLTTSAGTHGSLQLAASGMNSRTTISGNVLSRNGVGNGTTSGHGAADIFGYMDTWSNNISNLNNAVGFIDTDSILTTHTGDMAISNGQSTGGFHDGFLCEGCLYPKWSNIQGDDPTTNPQQGNVGHFDGDTYGGYAANITNAMGAAGTTFNDAGNGDTVLLAKNYSTGTSLAANYNAGTAQTVYTPLWNTTLRVSYSQAITQAATNSSTMPSLTLGWTDAGGIARTKQLVATSTSNATTVESDGYVTIYTNNVTPVTIISASYASSGATPMQYALAVIAETQ